MTQIARGKAFIYLGAGMESFAETAAASLNNQKVELIEIATLDDTLFSHPENHEAHAGHDYGDKDHHIWLVQLRMIQMDYIINNELNNVYKELEYLIINNYYNNIT